MITDYQKQALDFLAETNTTLEIKEATPQRMPTHWGGDKKDIEKHIHYTVTLKNKNHSYTFDYWGSVNDWEKVDAFRNTERLSFYRTPANYKKEDILKENSLFTDWRKMSKKEDREKYIKDNLSPSAYDVLACLSPVYEDTFEDWCASYGYSPDSRTAEKVYNLCIDQDRNIRKLFTHSELEKLIEIN